MVYFAPGGHNETKNYQPKIIWPSSPHKNSTSGYWETIVDQVNDFVSSGDYNTIYVKKENGRKKYSVI